MHPTEPYEDEPNLSAIQPQVPSHFNHRRSAGRLFKFIGGFVYKSPRLTKMLCCSYHCKAPSISRVVVLLPRHNEWSTSCAYVLSTRIVMDSTLL